MSLLSLSHFIFLFLPISLSLTLYFYFIVFLLPFPLLLLFSPLCLSLHFQSKLFDLISFWPINLPYFYFPVSSLFVLLTHTHTQKKNAYELTYEKAFLMEFKPEHISNTLFSFPDLSLTIKIYTYPFRKPVEAPTLAMIHGRVRARHCVNIEPTIKNVPQPTRSDGKGRPPKFRLFAAMA